MGLPADNVVEMLPMPTIRRPPGLSPAVRGVIDLRGRVLPVASLRQVFDLPSAADAREELLELLEGRLADHQRWLAELEASVLEERPFELTTDPHACAFGRWYDRYDSPHPLVRSVLKRFDGPHKAIHACGVEVLQRVAEGDVTGALQRIERERFTTLRRLVDLFGQAAWAVRESLAEIAVVLRHDGRHFAISVDQVDQLQVLTMEGGPDALGLEHPGHHLAGVGRNRDGRMILLADVPSLASVSAGGY